MRTIEPTFLYRVNFCHCHCRCGGAGGLCGDAVVCCRGVAGHQLLLLLSVWLFLFLLRVRLQSSASSTGFVLHFHHGLYSSVTRRTVRTSWLCNWWTISPPLVV